VSAARGHDVAFSEADLERARAKAGVETEYFGGAEGAEVLPGGSISFEGSHALVAEFTSAEATALAQAARWCYQPLEDVQVRFHAGGVECWGSIVPSRVRAAMVALGGEPEDVPDALSKYESSGPTPFYVKGKAAVVDGELMLMPQRVSAAGFSIPSFLANRYVAQVVDFLQERAGAIPGFSVSSCTFGEDVARFEGTVPDRKRVAV
jgi:hypothetical protein